MPIKGKSTQSWPDKIIDRVTSLWTDGHSAGYIARDIGKTRNAVISKLHRLNLMRGTSKKVYNPGIRTKRVRPAPQPGRVVAVAPKAPPQVYVEPASSVPPEQRVKLLDLEPHHCRWPIGDPKTPEFGFCGAHKTVASMYCQRHYSESRQALPVVKSGQFVLYEQRRRSAG